MSDKIINEQLAEELMTQAKKCQEPAAAAAFAQAAALFQVAVALNHIDHSLRVLRP